MARSIEGRLLKVTPPSGLEEGTVHIPSSKPETQRAIVAAALASGTSLIRQDLRCSETAATKEAVQRFGARIEEEDGLLRIEGVANRPSFEGGVIDCHGSGFAFRTMSVIASFVEGPVVITGDRILRTRIMAPLIEAIRELGGSIETICEKGAAPVVNYGNTFTGSRCSVPGNECSQFTTAFLLGLPLAERPLELNVEGRLASASYVQQTLDMLNVAGVDVGTERPANQYTITPTEYKAFTIDVGGDYTSASYLIAICALFECRIEMKGLYSKSHQGERRIVDFAQQIGLEVNFDDEKGICSVTNTGRPITGHFTMDVLDCPNILPTLAAIGAYIDGSLTVTGGSVTNYHKSPRITAMIEELAHMGVRITPVYAGEVLDGFKVYGCASYRGGVTLSSWGDHRIFLSLFIASLRTEKANKLEGYEGVHCSFPDFFAQADKLGIHYEETTDAPTHDEMAVERTLLEGLENRSDIGWI